MKIILDKLLKIFMLIYGIFLYSMALPLFLAISYLLGEFNSWFYELHWVIKVISSIIVGLLLIRWRDKKFFKIWNEKLK